MNHLRALLGSIFTLVKYEEDNDEGLYPIDVVETEQTNVYA